MKKIGRLLFISLVLFALPGEVLRGGGGFGKVSASASGGYYEICIQGDYAYCAGGENGLSIIDISNPAAPVVKGVLYTTYPATEVEVGEFHAYVGLGGYGINIVDISSISAPSLTAAYDPSTDWDESVGDIWVSGNYLYLAAWYHGLHVVNIANPSSPAFAANYNTPGQGVNIHGSGNYLYLADGYSGLQVFDVSNPASPVLKGNYSSLFVEFVYLQHGYVYIIDADVGRTRYLRVLDISNPSSPQLLGSCVVSLSVSDLYVAGNYAYIACAEQGMQIVSVSSSHAPAITGTFSGATNARGVAVKGNCAFLADNTEGLIAVDITDPTAPKLIGEVAPVDPPEITLNRTRLTYGAVASTGTVTGSQTFSITNTGEGPLNWIIEDSVTWLSYSSDGGQGGAAVSVTADPAGLSAGTHTATIAVSDVNASNSPQFIEVTLNVYASGSSQAPFGEFGVPADGITVSGSITVSGWVLDDIEVERVDISRVDGNKSFFIGSALFVEGARVDVESGNPGYPFNYKAGWGYMLLTNFLPNSGNGEFTLRVTAWDKEGKSALLGTRTIIADNANRVNPFGAIDTPAQGGTAFGAGYTNWGWVLTPMPNNIPTGGKTIDVYIDGMNLGHPEYNLFRNDISTLFPGYANSDGAAGYFRFNTTLYADGVHIIYWIARDSAGNADGIGSRYFTINNSGTRTGEMFYRKRRGRSLTGRGLSPKTVKMLPEDVWRGVKVVKGFREDTAPRDIYPGEEGIIRLETEVPERIVLRLPPGASPVSVGSEPVRFYGFTLAGEQLRPLPVGSTLDAEKGIFYWAPGPGFFGDYDLLFVKQGINGDTWKKRIRVRVVPKFSG